MYRGRRWFEGGKRLMEMVWGKRTEDHWCQERDSLSFADNQVHGRATNETSVKKNPGSNSNSNE